jgi:cytochrome c oxidase assembly factor CtaG
VALRAIWYRLTSPLVATVLHGAAIWVWHAPRLYEATLASSIVHATQHASFFVTALLFWWSVLRPSQRQARSGAPVLALFSTMMHSGLLGALIATAPALWYGAYATTTAAWGLTPLEDQQLAGLVMWIPASVSYVVATLVHATRWLREPGGTMARQGAFRAH